MLQTNRFALIDGDAIFDTVKPKGKGPGITYTTEDTRGCSCEQILDKLHSMYPDIYGSMIGQWQYGCSKSIMDEFIELGE